MLWTSCDLLGKVMFSSTLLQGNFLSLEQRRLIAMRVIEEGNRLQVRVRGGAPCGPGLLPADQPPSGCAPKRHVRQQGCGAPCGCFSSCMRTQVIQELKDLVEQKERFMSGMSHELRTPLNGIIGA